MVRGEEKQFEVTIERLLDYTKNVKVSLLLLIQKIEAEGENMEWPEVLDSFTSICGQINTLMRYTRENRSQFMENRAVLPLLLSPDKDEELAKLTEGRVQLVNHEMVPDYLRTKPDPEIEEFEKNLQAKANAIPSDAANKQVAAMTKLTENTANAIKANMARADNEMLRQSMKSSFNTADTNELLLAVSNGKNLRMTTTPSKDVLMNPVDPAMMQQQQQQIAQRQNVRAPELKTNIKAGPQL